MSTIDRLARWLFLLILIEAPWVYGSTRPWTVDLLDGLLMVSFLLNLPGFILRRFRRNDPFPLFPVHCLGLLLIEIVWMWYNARSYLDDSFWEFVPLPQPYPQWPGSWDRAATGFQLQSFVALFAGFLVAADMVNESRWRERLWLTMASTGISIVIYGMVQHVFSAPAIFWVDDPVGNTFFGPFRYHGNAGSFLNLIWPILVFLLVRSFRRAEAHLGRALWSSLLFLTLVGAGVNISRATASITVLLLFIAFFWVFPHARSRPITISWWKRLILVTLAGAFVATLVIVGGNSLSGSHWAQLSSQLTERNQRLLTYSVCLRTIPEAGWFGFGPGTFSAIFPFHTGYLGHQIYGFWRYAHEDYLQTVLEYGYVGATFWVLYFFGGLVMAVVRASTSSLGTTDRVSFSACALALGGIALHSLVDFPLQVASIQLYVAVFIALAWRVPGTGSRSMRSKSQGEIGLAIAGSV